MVVSQSAAVFVESGYLVYVRDGTLLAHPFDPDTLTFTGEPLAVAHDVKLTLQRKGTFSASSKTMIYATDTQAHELVWFDRTGRELHAKAISRLRDDGVRLSPDGNSIAFARREPHGSLNLWRMDVRQAIPTRVTHSDGHDDFPIWSPDAEFLVFRSSRAGTFDIYRKRSDGTGDAELLLASENTLHPSDWSPDGRYVAYTSREEPGIWMLPMEGKQKASFALAASAFREARPAFAPNGKFVAYQSDETGRYEIYVQSFPSTGRKWCRRVVAAVHDGAQMAKRSCTSTPPASWFRRASRPTVRRFRAARAAFCS